MGYSFSYGAIGTASCRALGIVLLSSATVAPAVSAESSSTLEEITVTATRRETDMQVTPIAVTALSSEALEAARVDDVRQLSALSPALVISGQAGQEYPISLRGISSGSQAVGGDSPVAIYLDGVYLGRQQASLFDLADIKRIEISRGPQGTLFGRNNTAGAINIITAQPSDEAAGKVSARYGSRNEVSLKGAYNLPLSDQLFLKIAATSRSIDGFETWQQTGRKVNGERSTAVNTGMRWVSGEGTDIDLRADYSKATFPLAVRLITPIGRYGIDKCPIDCDQLNAEDGHAFDQDVENYGAGLTVTHELNEQLTLKSITGARRFKVDYIFNNDSTEYVIQRFDFHPVSDQLSQELTLSGNHDRFNWLTGVYYFWEDSDSPYAQDYSPNGTNIQITAARAYIETNSYAVFADGTYDITDALSLSAGVRYSSDKKDFVRDGANGVGTYTPGTISPLPAFVRQYDLSNTWNSTSPRVSLNYKFTPDVFGYVTVSKGDKSGGYSFSGSGTADLSFDPEEVRSYEIGLKNTLLDGQFRLNLSAFYYDYTGLQVAVATAAAVRTIFNAASAEVTGAELELEFAPAALPGLSISGNASYLDATYKEFNLPVANAPSCIGGVFTAATLTCNLEGNELPRAPKFQSTLIGAYEIATPGGGRIVPQVKVTYQDAMFYTEQNDIYASKEATTEFDAQISYRPTDSWAFTVWGKNLTDKRYIANGRQANVRNTAIPGSPFSTPFVGEYGVPNAPRAYGVEASLRF